ncbi:hypothetical protein TNIN_244471 [Trichonephila inaurata madagascariensis]|uniref:Uncharacterized protein n=1 Tax=Trichonephila inaurata madagascariensis TaxID=2747483 RepID=A0A8X6WQV5_9ARAC|nr:hypothetical protein TNIN_244471 [Trichonephila inaurata madagascariensis]
MKPNSPRISITQFMEPTRKYKALRMSFKPKKSFTGRLFIVISNTNSVIYFFEVGKRGTTRGAMSVSNERREMEDEKYIEKEQNDLLGLFLKRKKKRKEIQ